VGSCAISLRELMGDPFEKEDIVEGVDGRRERENSCRVSGLLEQRHRADSG